jgi:hypothetical protein
VVVEELVQLELLELPKYLLEFQTVAQVVLE